MASWRNLLVGMSEGQHVCYCDIKEAPWYVARRTTSGGAPQPDDPLPFAHPPRGGSHEAIKLPPRQKRSYSRPPKSSQRMVPLKYEVES